MTLLNSYSEHCDRRRAGGEDTEGVLDLTTLVGSPREPSDTSSSPGAGLTGSVVSHDAGAGSRRILPTVALGAFFGLVAVAAFATSCGAVAADAPIEVATTAPVVVLGSVPERRPISTWDDDAPDLTIPLLGLTAPLGRGQDAGPGPAVWPGTPWPGDEGRSVIFVLADLTPLRVGDQLEISGQSQWVVTKVGTVTEDQLGALTAQPQGVRELTLVEATTFRAGPRTTATAWRTR